MANLNFGKAQKEREKSLFDFKKVSLIFLVPLPIDGTEGLVLESSYLTIEDVGNARVNYKVGLFGEVLISENLNTVRTLSVKYLPNADSVPTLDILKKLGTQFGVFIQNNSSPKYKGMASECRILEIANPGIGTGGFTDCQYKILMTDYLDIYIPDKIQFSF